MDSQDNILTTERMDLRRFQLDDAGLLYELDSDPEVMAFLSRKRPQYDVIRNQHLPWLLELYEQHPGFGIWAAIERESGRFLGWFELMVRSEEQTKRPELGYRLRSDAWGVGYATEGSLALLHKAFEELRVDAMFAQTMAVNHRSRRVMEKIGMRHTRTSFPEFDDPLPGSEEGEVEYEITRDEWFSSR